MLQKEKQIWFELNENQDKTLLEKVYQLDYSCIFLNYNTIKQLNEIVPPRKFQFGILIDTIEELKELSGNSELKQKTKAIFIKDDHLKEKIKKLNFKVGLYLSVNDKESLEYVTKIAHLYDYVLIEFKDPTNIPLELILAETQNKNVHIIKKVKTAIDGSVSFLTMEKGSDAILLNTDDLTQVIELNKTFNEINTIELRMREAIVTNIKHAGMGDRVCVDTTSELFQDEGMILGSTSSGGLMVCSETHYLPYMNLRPFRVNAGSLHLYCWGPNNKVYYLSDLKAGDELLVVNSKGMARVVTIGRLKIERRPLLYIEAKIDDNIINTFIQDDWHVRMMGAKGNICPSSEIKIGDKLLGFIDEPGRHVGIKINETIKEL